MKNQRWWGILAIAILLAGAIWHASLHQPAGPAEGVEIRGVEFINDKPNESILVSGDRAAFPPVRVGTFNLHGCKGLDNRIDISRSAKCLENLDFAALEEIHGPGLFGGYDQAAELGKQLKMGWLFAPAVRQWYFSEFGNGFLTSLPVTFWERIPLQSHRDYSFRNVVLLGLKQKNCNGRERVVNILVTHINRRYDEDRQAQLRAVIALFMSLQQPAILLGDLNATTKDPQIAEILNNSELTDPVGQALGSKDDPQRIDWIFCRGLKCRTAGILENDASDHPLVWAELE